MKCTHGHYSSPLEADMAGQGQRSEHRERGVCNFAPKEEVHLEGYLNW